MEFAVVCIVARSHDRTNPDRIGCPHWWPNGRPLPPPRVFEQQLDNRC
jgi:hypothetical protein